jgi:hypothetical protein
VSEGIAGRSDASADLTGLFVEQFDYFDELDLFPPRTSLRRNNTQDDTWVGSPSRGDSQLVSIESLLRLSAPAPAPALSARSSSAANAATRRKKESPATHVVRAIDSDPLRRHPMQPPTSSELLQLLQARVVPQGPVEELAGGRRDGCLSLCDAAPCSSSSPQPAQAAEMDLHMLFCQGFPSSATTLREQEQDGAGFSVLTAPPRSAYVAALERRIAHLEQLLADAIAAGPATARPPTAHAPHGRQLTPVTELGDSTMRSIINGTALPLLEGTVKDMLLGMRRAAGADQVVHVTQQVLWRMEESAGEKVMNPASKQQERENAMVALARSPDFQARVDALCQLEVGSRDWKVVLSTLALSMDRTDFNTHALAGHAVPPVTPYYYTQARSNALDGGVCWVPTRAHKIVRRSLCESHENPESSLELLIKVISSHSQNLAYGTRRHVLSHGEELLLPAVELSTSKTVVMQSYLEAIATHNTMVEEEGGTDVLEPLPARLLEETIKAMTGGRVSNLAALDSTYWRFGLLTFERLAKIIELATKTQDPAYNAYLHRLCHEVKQYITHVLPLHLRTRSSCKMHCKEFALDGEPCPACAQNRCSDCDFVFILQQEVEWAVMNAVLRTGEETAAQLLHWLCTVVFPDLLQYVGHIVRKAHDAGVMAKKLQTMDRETGVVVQVDYAMKMKLTEKRETQQGFFGQRGASYQGVSFVYTRLIAVEVEEDEDEDEEDAPAPEAAQTTTSSTTAKPKKKKRTRFVSEMVMVTHDQFCDDAQENSEHTSQLTLASFAVMKQEVPRLRDVTLMTDGAGAYTSTELLMTLIQAGERTGMRVVEHIVKQPGNGKCRLDAHFAYVKMFVYSLVAEMDGHADLHCARDIARNAAIDGGMVNARVFDAEVSRVAPTKATTARGRRSKVEEEGEQWEQEEDHAEDTGSEAEDGAMALGQRSRIKPLRGIDGYHSRVFQYASPEAMMPSSVAFHALPLWKQHAPALTMSVESLIEDHCPNGQLPTATLAVLRAHTPDPEPVPLALPTRMPTDKRNGAESTNAT